MGHPTMQENDTAKLTPTTPIRKQEWSSKRSRKLKNMFNSNLFYL